MENNEEKVVYWSEVEKDIKRYQFKQKVKQVFVDVKVAGLKAVDYVKEHPQVIIGAVGVGTEAVKVGLRVADRHDKIRAQRTYYDHSSQQRMRTKKHLTNKQKMQAYDIHQQTGKTYTDIYKEMGVL